MFYPVDSLKKGGRFYYCWMADSWPSRFTQITRRQLWSQDVRKLCDDLLQVMMNESGRPTKRFSLRLSSQLMRGLVRLYERKVALYLSDLCMINANVMKCSNKSNLPRTHHSPEEGHRLWLKLTRITFKRFNIHDEIDNEDRIERRRTVQQLPLIVVTEEQEPEQEQRVEELIQNSGNVAINIQDITLKEATIPDFQLPPNDGFGEENLEQTLQILADRSVEMMMVPTEPAQHSQLELPMLDSTEKSHDKSHLPPDLRMERISDHDLTLFRKLTGEGLLPPEELDKEVPEISDIPIPELPPQDKQLEREKETSPASEIQVQPEIRVENAPHPNDTELEELEVEPIRKRRKNTRLIIDKRIQISGEQMRARVNNNNVELRCESSIDDAIDLRVPFDIFVKRSCHSGVGFYSKISAELEYLFVRNLAAVAGKPAVEERELEMAAMQRSNINIRSMLDHSEKAEQPVTPQRQIEQEQLNITYADIIVHAPQEPNVSTEQQVLETREEELAEMLTQKIDTLPLQTRKRSSAAELQDESPKRLRQTGYVSFRQSQQVRQSKEAEIPITIEPEIPLQETGANKENIPFNLQSTQREDVDINVTAMLKEVGLADVQTHQPEIQQVSQPQARTNGNTCSEPMLGSLDRTKVSLGDSEHTTDSTRFIRDQWSAERTMIRIMKLIKKGNVKLNFDALLSSGPLIAGYKRMIAARCFSSILKLKQHGFIRIKKDKNLEIEEICFGPRLEYSP